MTEKNLLLQLNKYLCILSFLLSIQNPCFGQNAHFELKFSNSAGTEIKNKYKNVIWQNAGRNNYEDITNAANQFLDKQNKKTRYSWITNTLWDDISNKKIDYIYDFSLSHTVDNNELRMPQGEEFSIREIFYSEQNKTALINLTNGILCLWDMKINKIAKLKSISNLNTNIFLSNTGKYFCSIEGNKITIYNLESNTEIISFNGTYPSSNKGDTYDVVFSENDQHILFYIKGTVRVYDIKGNLLTEKENSMLFRTYPNSSIKKAKFYNKEGSIFILDINRKGQFILYDLKGKQIGTEKTFTTKKEGKTSINQLIIDEALYYNYPDLSRLKELDKGANPPITVLNRSFERDLFAFKKNKDNDTTEVTSPREKYELEQMKKAYTPYIFRKESYKSIIAGQTSTDILKKTLNASMIISIDKIDFKYVLPIKDDKYIVVAMNNGSLWLSLWERKDVSKKNYHRITLTKNVGVQIRTEKGNYLTSYQYHFTCLAIPSQRKEDDPNQYLVSKANLTEVSGSDTVQNVQKLAKKSKYSEAFTKIVKEIEFVKKRLVEEQEKYAKDIAENRQQIRELTQKLQSSSLSQEEKKEAENYLSNLRESLRKNENSFEKIQQESRRLVRYIDELNEQTKDSYEYGVLMRDSLDKVKERMDKADKLQKVENENKKLQNQNLITSFAIFGFLIFGLIAYVILKEKQQKLAALQNDKLEAQYNDLIIQKQQLDEKTKLLEKQKDDLEDKTDEIELQKENISNTLENLKATQAQLIQSEKLAVMGKLVASVAHEINTPLGAIRASAGNIVTDLNEALQELPKLFQILSTEQQENFFALVSKALATKALLSSREERAARKVLQNELESHEIANADDLAYELATMGIYENVSPFLVLFKDKEALFITKIAYHLVNQQRSTDNINVAVDRASKVVFALKTYARHDQSGEKVKANIMSGIETVLTLYHNQLKQHTEVIRNYSEVPEILCFPDELNQVWTNLIHNAMHAMSTKGKLEINIQQVENSIEVSIKDNGKGIPEDIKGRVFDAFFTTKPEGEGSGLGLDIVKKIIDKHDGQIGFDSEVGKGTRFWVRLPVQ